MHLVIGTPMYGGMCCSEYVQSILALKDAMQQHDHKVTCVFLGNESLIQRGRNTLAWHFLNTDATHLLFCDADQKFKPADVAKMIKADKDIIVGCVPMKGINWDRVRRGALRLHPNLSQLTGIFNINELEGHSMTDPNEPFQIKHGGSGFMLIKRDVFEKLKPHVETYSSTGVSLPKDTRIYNFFQVGVKDDLLLSEDYYFCDKYREIGGTIWAAPWCEIGHFGSYLFKGQYAEGTV